MAKMQKRKRDKLPVVTLSSYSLLLFSIIADLINSLLLRFLLLAKPVDKTTVGTIVADSVPVRPVFQGGWSHGQQRAALMEQIVAAMHALQLLVADKVLLRLWLFCTEDVHLKTAF
jgi:hypothetical protein